MKKLLTVLFAVLLISCSDDEVNKEESAIQEACKKCQTTPEQMGWLREIIKKDSEATGAKGTRIYAIPLAADGVVIVNQPIVMSCMACLRYNCDGTTVTSLDAVLLQEIQTGVRNENLIYSSY